MIGAVGLVLAPPAPARSRRPVALVTADEEARLVAVDLATGRVVRHVPTLASPRSIEKVGDSAVIAHSELGAVSLVQGLDVVRVLHGFEEPRYTAAHPDGRHAYVTDASRGEIVAVDVLHGRVLARERSLSSSSRVGLGRGSYGGSVRRFWRTTSAGRRTVTTSG